MNTINFGVNVEVTLMDGRRFKFHNVTEIHYRHQPERLSVAFESDIHGTGCNYPVRKVAEFATELAFGKYAQFETEMSKVEPVKLPLTLEDFHKGQAVNVKRFEDDLFNHDFTGTVKSVDMVQQLVVVEDQDGFCWSCEVGQLSWNSDEYMH